MNIELARFLVEAAENAGNEAELREEYYGRGMGDNHTVGVVVESPAQLLCDVIQLVRENLVKDGLVQGHTVWTYGPMPEAESLRIDNVGHGVILY